MSTFEKEPYSSDPRFYVAGVDLGQKQDHSAVAVVDKVDRKFDLVHLKQFQLGTEYGSVVGYLKLLNENLHDLRRIMIDQTGVGETFMSMAINSGLKNARGIELSQPKKQDVMTFLKHCMQDELVHIPYDREFMNELNVERFELLETGRLKFSHPPGTHDDRLWAFALAIYYARLEPAEYHPVGATGRNPNSLMPDLPEASGNGNLLSRRFRCLHARTVPGSLRDSVVSMTSTSLLADSGLSSTATRALGPSFSLTKSMFKA